MSKLVQDSGKSVKVRLTGSIKNGKLDLDPAAFDDVSGGSMKTDGDGVFVAVNAPFDPVVLEEAA